jgi:hypothetical protein
VYFAKPVADLAKSNSNYIKTQEQLSKKKIVGLTHSVSINTPVVYLKQFVAKTRKDAIICGEKLLETKHKSQ